MNQILVAGNKNGKNNNSSVDIKKVILFFCIAIIVFGIILIVSGVIGLNKAKEYDKYSGILEIPVVPTPDTTPTTSPTSNTDEENPVIDLMVAGESIKIVVKDETELEYIEYSWNDEEPQKVVAEDENKKELTVTAEIKKGTNTLKVVAVDKAGNVQEKTQDFQGTVRPTVGLNINVEGNAILIKSHCEDGIGKLEFTQNGKWKKIVFEGTNYTKEQWATVNVNVELDDNGKIIYVEYSVPLKEGENVIDAYAYSLEGLVGNAKGKTEYPAAQ